MDNIDKIEDASTKRKMIEYYLSTFKKEEESPLPNYLPYSLKKVLDDMKEINSSTIEKPSTLPHLKGEINILKKEIQEIKNRLSHVEASSSSISPPSISEKDNFLTLIDNVTFQKWYINISIIIDKDFILKDIVLVESGADINCIKEGLVPTKYFHKITQSPTTADSSKLKIKFKLSNTYICNE